MSNAFRRLEIPDWDAYAIVFRAVRMPEYFRDNVNTLLVSEDTARHRGADEFSIVHKKVPHAEADVIREDGPLICWQGLDTLSPTLGRGPPV